MNKISILLFCVLGSVICDPEFDEEHNDLHRMAQQIMTGLQKEHIPSEESSTSATNAPLHHLNEIHRNPGLIDKTDKTKITVEVKGTKFVSVERNGKVFNITTVFGVGSVALYSIDKDNEFDLDFEQMEYKKLVNEENEREIDDSLEAMDEIYIQENSMASPNETKVILGQRAKFGMRVKPNRSDKDVKIIVHHGYIVAAKTNVTKGYVDYD